MKLKEFLQKNSKAIRFLVVFIVLYLLLNTLYGLFVEHYYPTCDPITIKVADEIVWVLSWVDPEVKGFSSAFNANIAIANEVDNVIYFFEGCNGINVMIVYLSFLVAFKGPLKLLVRYSVLGLLGIHLLNLLRVSVLYGIAIHFPMQLYFFHKYLFTGILYLIVFVFWYYWVKGLRHE